MSALTLEDDLIMASVSAILGPGRAMSGFLHYRGDWSGRRAQ